MVSNSIPSDGMKANTLQSFKMKLKAMLAAVKYFSKAVTYFSKAVKYFRVELFVCISFLLNSFLFYVVMTFI